MSEEQPEDRDLLRDERKGVDTTASEETEAAAAEAGAIGGADPAPEVDPEDRAVLEGGGGESEGFEQAEEALIEQASHGDAPTSPTQDRFTPEEAHPVQTDAEADAVEPSEVTSDPEAEGEDPGQGPGIAEER